MLAPHRREDPKLRQVRRAAENGAGAGELLGAQPHFGGQLRGGVTAVAIHDHCKRSEAISRRRSTLPHEIASSRSAPRNVDLISLKRARQPAEESLAVGAAQ